MCICDPMLGVLCATHAELVNRVRWGGFDATAHAAGWVPLTDVLDALRDEDAYHRWRKALTGVRPEYPPLTTRRHLADYLAERFTPTTAPESEKPRCDCDPAAHLDLHRPWCATQTAPEGADERNGHG